MRANAFCGATYVFNMFEPNVANIL